MSDKITITEGLAVLKNVNARIQKGIDSANFLATYQIGKAPNGFKSVDDFVAKAKESLQSVTDLIKRRNAIKAAIVASNATTQVTIAGEVYTVAAAIERKSSITLQNALLQRLHAQFTTNCNDFNRKTAEAQLRLDSLLEQNFGKDTSKRNETAVAAITDDFMSRNEYKLSDPLDAKKVAEKLANEINDFITNVDVALSISNATTFIEV